MLPLVVPSKLMIKSLLSIGLLLLLGVSSPLTGGTLVEIEGPPTSGTFGSLLVLPNGYTVVVDTGYDQPSPAVSDVGAVYLYDPDGVLVSSLVGSSPGDAVGSQGIQVLENGNFVVR